MDSMNSSRIKAVLSGRNQVKGALRCFGSDDRPGAGAVLYV